MAGIIVGIFVAHAVAQLLCAPVGGVAQVDGYGLVVALLRVGKGRVPRQHDGIGLGRFAEEDDCLRERKPRLRHADVLEGVRRGYGLYHGLGIGKADILRGVGNEPPRDDARVYARIDHARKPGQRRIRIAAAQRFAEGREHVVIQLLIALDDLALAGLGGDVAGDVDCPVGLRRGGEHRKLQRVQGIAAVAVCHCGDKLQRVPVHAHLPVAKAALRIRERRAQRLLYVLGGERIELKHPAARDDGRGHGDHGILRGGADEAHSALFQGGQQAVALGPAPAVTFIQQKIGGLAVELETLCRRVDDFAQLLYAGGYGVELCKGRARAGGDDGSKRRLPRAGRAEEDGGLQPVRQDGAAQQLALANDMPLPDKLVQRARPHAVGKRRSVPLVSAEKMLHGVPPGFAARFPYQYSTFFPTTGGFLKYNRTFV